MIDFLHRTNLNLYMKDVEYLRKRYGYGWTEKVREIVRAAIREMQTRAQPEPEVLELKIDEASE